VIDDDRSHDRSGAPGQAFVVTRTQDGARVAACTPPGDAAEGVPLSLWALPPGRTTQVGRPVRLRPLPGGPVSVRPS